MPLPPFGSNGLLPDGLHPANEADLRWHCVHSFTDSTTRQSIFEGFLVYRIRLEALGLNITQWVDGSFVDQQRLNPDDIDVVNFVHSAELSRLSSDALREAMDLLMPDPRTKRLYFTHTFHVQLRPTGDPHPHASTLPERVRYWRKLFTTPQTYGLLGQKRPAPERGTKGIIHMTVGDTSLAPTIDFNL